MFLSYTNDIIHSWHVKKLQKFESPCSEVKSSKYINYVWLRAKLNQELQYLEHSQMTWSLILINYSKFYMNLFSFTYLDAWIADDKILTNFIKKNHPAKGERKNKERGLKSKPKAQKSKEGHKGVIELAWILFHLYVVVFKCTNWWMGRCSKWILN
jgi:hypothetical protein